MIPNFFRQALRGEPLSVFGDGRQTRSIMFVDDLVEGVWRLLRSSYVGPVNIGSQDEVSVIDLARAIIRVSESVSPISFGPLPPDDPKVRRPDTSLAKRVLDWAPRVPIEEGLRRTRAWFAEALARDGDPAR
jgi:dTDP-glucose 4,6-dehydratase